MLWMVWSVFSFVLFFFFSLRFWNFLYVQPILASQSQNRGGKKKKKVQREYRNLFGLRHTPHLVSGEVFTSKQYNDLYFVT